MALWHACDGFSQIEALLKQGQRHFIWGLPVLRLDYQAGIRVDLKEFFLGLDLLAAMDASMLLTVDVLIGRQDKEYCVKLLHELKKYPAIQGVIFQDPGWLRILAELGWTLILGHLQPVFSTETAQFWVNQGIKNFILAPDISSEQKLAIQSEFPDLVTYSYILGNPVKAHFPPKSMSTLNSCGEKCSTKLQDALLAEYQFRENHHGMLVIDSKPLISMDMLFEPLKPNNHLIIDNQGYSLPLLLRVNYLFQEMMTSGTQKFSLHVWEELLTLTKNQQHAYVGYVVEAGELSVIQTLSSVHSGERLNWFYQKSQGKVYLREIRCVDGEMVESLEAGRFFVIRENLPQNALLQRDA